MSFGVVPEEIVAWNPDKAPHDRHEEEGEQLSGEDRTGTGVCVDRHGRDGDDRTDDDDRDGQHRDDANLHEG